jgi:hypothetical protein
MAVFLLQEQASVLGKNDERVCSRNRQGRIRPNRESHSISWDYKLVHVYRNETDENHQANIHSASMPRVSMMWEKSYGLLLPSIRLALPQSCSRLVPFDPNILHLVPSDTLKSVREDIVNHVNAAEHVEFTTVYLQEGFA